MTRNSTLFVFSVICNVEAFLKNGKDIDLFKNSHFKRLERASKYYTDNARKMFNEIENGYYTINELVIYLLSYAMIEPKKINLYKIKFEHIIEAMKLFTNKKKKEDLELITKIYNEIGFKKGICDFFEFKEDGTNIAYILTKNNKISPIFFIRNYENCLTKQKENDIIKDKEYERFEKIASKIKKIL